MTHQLAQLVPRLGLTLGLVAAAAVLLAGCGSGSDDASGTRVPFPPTLAPRGQAANQGIVTETIGRSVEGRDIEAVTVGSGGRAVVVIGGLHTGIEAETVELVEQMLGEYSTRPNSIPRGVRLVLIPNANPDGYENSSRANANGVDLNRNWPTGDWAETATHSDAAVFGGEAPISEPETEALYDFLKELRPEFVLSFHGYAGLVQYNETGQAERLGLAFAEAADYEAIDEWPFYAITGEMIEAMADLDIPAADVELVESDDRSFERAREGLAAVLRGLE